MKWLTLKIHMLPMIFKEIDFVTEDYMEMLNKIRKAKAESNSKEVKEVDEEDDDDEIEIVIKKFNGLRESITKRINELEEFYENNIEDIRISNFEKARIRLKKLLMYDVSTINRVINSSQKPSLFIKNKVQKLTEETKKKMFESNLLEKNIEDRYGDNIRGVNSANKVLSEKSSQKHQKTPPSYMNPLNRSRKSTIKNITKEFSQKLGSFSTNNENTNEASEFANCKELIFKIRLTPEEYRRLVKEKNKK